MLEIGYGINKDYRNCGYMTEAVEAIVRGLSDKRNVKWRNTLNQLVAFGEK